MWKTRFRWLHRWPVFPFLAVYYLGRVNVGMHYQPCKAAENSTANKGDGVMTEHKWNPAEKYEKPPELLPINAPPCVNCAYWRPERIYAQVHHEVLENARKRRDESIEATTNTGAEKASIAKGTISSQYYDGVRLCHSPSMEHDFSCFREIFLQP